ncbi:MAG: hypothetical protein ACE5JZ_00755, partial [Kiloniellales bacterium]
RAAGVSTSAWRRDSLAAEDIAMSNDLVMPSACELVEGYRDGRPSPVAATKAAPPFVMPELRGPGPP